MHPGSDNYGKKGKKNKDMENIFFFWWLKYTITSQEGKHISDVIEDVKKDIPDFEELKSTVKETEKLYKLMEEYLDCYRKTGNNLYLQKIEKANQAANRYLTEAYKKLDFFNKFTPVAEEAFLEKEATKIVDSSGIFTGMKHVLNSYFKGTIEEDKVLDYLDGLRDIIYELQEEEVTQLSETKEELFNLQASTEAAGFATLLKKALNNLEEGLELIEKSLRKNSFTDGEKGLLQTRRGLIEIKVIEMLGGVIK